MSDKIVFCFDGDAAGQQVALAASTVLLPLFKDGKDARFLSLQENQDPDDLVKEQGPSAFDSNQAVQLSRFVLQKLAAGVLLGNLKDRTQIVTRTRKLLLPLPKTLFKNLSHGGACQKSRAASSRSRAPTVPGFVAAVSTEVIPATSAQLSAYGHHTSAA